MYVYRFRYTVCMFTLQMHRHIRMYVHMYTCTYIRTYLCANTHSYTNPCVHSRFPRTYVCTYVVSSLLFLYRHRPLQSHAFIPYSHWLGGILKDIHRVLLLAASTEGNSKTLVQILKVQFIGQLYVMLNAQLMIECAVNAV